MLLLISLILSLHRITVTAHLFVLLAIVTSIILDAGVAELGQPFEPGRIIRCRSISGGGRSSGGLSVRDRGVSSLDEVH